MLRRIGAIAVCRADPYYFGAVLFMAIVIGIALLLVLNTFGSFAQLAHLRLQAFWLLFGALAIQIALEYVHIPKDKIDTVGFGILMASYALILAFCFINLRIRGMAVVMIGIAMNTLVIGLNQGMPTKDPGKTVHGKIVPAITVEVKHRPKRSDDLLPWLGDTIVLEPIREIISFGDLVLAVGLCDVLFWGSRRPKRGKKPRRRGRGDNAPPPPPPPEPPSSKAPTPPDLGVIDVPEAVVTDTTGETDTPTFSAPPLEPARVEATRAAEPEPVAPSTAIDEARLDEDTAELPVVVVDEPLVVAAPAPPMPTHTTRAPEPGPVPPLVVPPAPPLVVPPAPPLRAPRPEIVTSSLMPSSLMPANLMPPVALDVEDEIDIREPDAKPPARVEPAPSISDPSYVRVVPPPTRHRPDSIDLTEYTLPPETSGATRRRPKQIRPHGTASRRNTPGADRDDTQR